MQRRCAAGPPRPGPPATMPPAPAPACFPSPVLSQALVNMPTYGQHLAAAAYFRGALGWALVPGSASSLDRFARLAYASDQLALCNVSAAGAGGFQGVLTMLATLRAHSLWPQPRFTTPATYWQTAWRSMYDQVGARGGQPGSRRSSAARVLAARRTAGATGPLPRARPADPRRPDALLRFHQPPRRAAVGAHGGAQPVRRRARRGGQRSVAAAQRGRRRRHALPPRGAAI